MAPNQPKLRTDWVNQMLRISEVTDHQLRRLRQQQVIEAFSTFGGAPTGRGTIFIFRSKFLSYRGRGWAFSAAHPPGGGPFSFFAANFYPIRKRGSPAGQGMNNFLPGETSLARNRLVAPRHEFSVKLAFLARARVPACETR